MLIVAVSLLGVLLFISLIARRVPKRLNNKYFKQRWRELQRHCSKAETWPLAIISADNLLDEALKKRKYSGRTTGERMTSANKVFTNKDAVWLAHKLRNKLVHESTVKLRQKDVKNALVGFRQALVDLGAL
jgi:hypothetical protein